MVEYGESARFGRHRFVSSLDVMLVLEEDEEAPSSLQEDVWQGIGPRKNGTLKKKAKEMKKKTRRLIMAMRAIISVVPAFLVIAMFASTDSALLLNISVDAGLSVLLSTPQGPKAFTEHCSREFR